jgi:hypothetical protein
MAVVAEGGLDCALPPVLRVLVLLRGGEGDKDEEDEDEEGDRRRRLPLPLPPPPESSRREEFFFLSFPRSLSLCWCLLRPSRSRSLLRLLLPSLLL